MLIRTMLHGFSMALADSVPGVSGGTIAFIMGFYEQLLSSLQNLLGKGSEARKKAFIYLVKFALGWGIGMGGSVLLLSRVFESNIYFLSSLFLGLTVSAIPFIIYEERECMKGRYQNLVFVLLGIFMVVSMSFLRAALGGGSSISFQSLSILQYVYLFIASVAAISAMLLPGISGSTLLLILGIYVPAIGAVKEVLSLNLQYLPGVVTLAAGVFAGIFFAASYIRKGLACFRSQMVYLIIGLMLGSLYAIVMGPTTLDMPKAPLDFSSFSILAFVIGIAILGGLEWTKRIMERRDAVTA